MPRKPRGPTTGEPAAPVVVTDPETGAKVIALVRPGSGRAAAEGRKGRKVSNGSQTSPAAIEVTERRARVLAMRRGGAGFVDIARIMRERHGCPASYDNKAAWQDVRDSLERIRVESVADYVEESVARLDWALSRIAEKVDAGDLDAIDRLVKIEKRRADLVGLDAARRISVAGPDGGPVQVVASFAVDDPTAYDDAVAALDELLGPPRPALT